MRELIKIFPVLILIGSSGCSSMPSTSTTVANTNTAHSATPEASNWVLSTDASPMDRTHRLTLQTEAKEIPNGTLIVRFTGSRLEVYVITEDVIGEDTSVRIKFDEGTPIRQTWNPAKDAETLFSPDPTALLAKLQGATRFYIEYKPYDKIPQTITFDVAGLSAILPQEQKDQQQAALKRREDNERKLQEQMRRIEEREQEDKRTFEEQLRARVLPHVHECTQRNIDGTLKFPWQWCWSTADPNPLARCYSDRIPYATKEQAVASAMDAARSGVHFQ